MKQTAVEWLYHELDDIPQLYSHEWDAYKIAIQKAKQMEKEQIMDAHSDGALHTDWDENTDVIENAQDYYNETFNTNENERG